MYIFSLFYILSSLPFASLLTFSITESKLAMLGFTSLSDRRFLIFSKISSLVESSTFKVPAWTMPFRSSLSASATVVVLGGTRAHRRRILSEVDRSSKLMCIVLKPGWMNTCTMLAGLAGHSHDVILSHCA